MSLRPFDLPHLLVTSINTLISTAPINLDITDCFEESTKEESTKEETTKEESTKEESTKEESTK